MKFKDAEIRDQLKNWRKIIRPYQTPDNKKAIWQVLNTFGPLLALWILMYFSMQWSVLLTLALAALGGLFTVRVFIIQHDCGHHSFFHNKKVNNVVGFVCSFFTSIPYKYWAHVHNVHHGHAGQMEMRDWGDIHFLTVEEFRALSPFRKFAYRVFRSPLMLFVGAPFLYLTISNRIPIFKRDNWINVRWSQVYNNLAITGVYVLLCYLLGWKTFLLIQASIVMCFGVVAFWFFYVQHQHEHCYKQWRENWDYLLASVKGSTFYRLPKVLQWFSGNIGFHHIHHLSPRIPNYNLEQCARENPILQKYVTTITFRQSLACVFNKLWDEQQQKMISFQEFYHLERIRLSM